MYCTRCGKEIEISADSRFCNGCGLEYQWQPVQTPEEIVPYNQIQPIQSGNNTNQQAVMEKIGTSIDNRDKAGKTVAGIFFLILAIPLAIVGFMFFGAILLIIF